MKNSHYYVNDPNLGSNKKEVKYTFKGVNVNLNSDMGVFSKDRIDFGSNVLLNSLDELENVKSVLDIGCGYGVLGICIAKKYPDKNITMVDVNERCISLTKENINNNKLKNAECFISDVCKNVSSKYDMVISNPPIRAGKVVVNRVIEEGYQCLSKGGSIWVVIQKKQGGPSLEKRMEEVFGNVETVNKEKGYFIFKSTKE